MKVMIKKFTAGMFSEQDFEPLTLVRSISHVCIALVLDYCKIVVGMVIWNADRICEYTFEKSEEKNRKIICCKRLPWALGVLEFCHIHGFTGQLGFNFFCILAFYMVPVKSEGFTHYHHLSCKSFTEICIVIYYFFL